MENLSITRCTRERPWRLGSPARGPVVHEDARLTSSDYYSDRYECPNCGLTYELVRDMLPSAEPANGTWIGL